MKNDQITISAKNLGALALPNACKRCYYIKLKNNFKTPFDIFPSIFSSIDSYSKKITNNYFTRHNKVPKWFNQFGSFVGIIPAPHWSKFSLLDKETNIVFRGSADEILQQEDGTVWILDYKTSRYTGNDSLKQMYLVQLNVYQMIAESQGLKVSGLGLVYYQPQTDIDINSVDEVVSDGSFDMGFEPHLLEIDIEGDRLIRPLLKEVRELWERSSPPEGTKGCKNCLLLQDLIRISEVK